MTIRVGSIAIAKKTCGVCSEGERGVCYEVYKLDGRPGYSFIFANDLRTHIEAIEQERGQGPSLQ